MLLMVRDEFEFATNVNGDLEKRSLHELNIKNSFYK